MFDSLTDTRYACTLLLLFSTFSNFTTGFYHLCSSLLLSLPFCCLCHPHLPLTFATIFATFAIFATHIYHFCYLCHLHLPLTFATMFATFTILATCICHFCYLYHPPLPLTFATSVIFATAFVPFATSSFATLLCWTLPNLYIAHICVMQISSLIASIVSASLSM